MVKQITVEELFGQSLPKDPALPAMPAQNPPVDPSAAYLQNPAYSPAAHQSPLLPPHLAPHDPASAQRHQAPALLPAPYQLHPSPVFQVVASRPDPQSHCAVPPLMMPPEPPAAPPAAYLGQDILSSLKPAVPPVNADVHKPALAPNFLPSTLVPPQSFQELMGKPLLQHGKEMDVYTPAPNLVKSMTVC